MHSTRLIIPSDSICDQCAFKQVEVLQESKNMVPDCQRRLERAIADLKATIVRTQWFTELVSYAILLYHTCRGTVVNLRTLRYIQLLLNNWKQYFLHRPIGDQNNSILIVRDVCIIMFSQVCIFCTEQIKYLTDTETHKFWWVYW